MIEILHYLLLLSIRMTFKVKKTEGFRQTDFSLIILFEKQRDQIIISLTRCIAELCSLFFLPSIIIIISLRFIL